MNRSPGIAGILSVVFPGLGHFYAGATPRGFALAGGFLAFLQGAVNHATATAIAAPALFLVWLFGIVDAIRVTEETIRARAAGEEPDVGLDRRWAIGLVVAGGIAVLSLVEQFTWLIHLWPLLLIWSGVQMLRGQPIVPDGAAFARLVNRPPEPEDPAPPPSPPLAPAPPPAAPEPDDDIEVEPDGADPGDEPPVEGARTS